MFHPKLRPNWSNPANGGVADRVIAKRVKHVPTRHMELGLCDLADILPSYLQDANTWLDTKHPEIRDAFVCG